jgi:predicted transcriptional regulator
VTPLQASGTILGAYLRHWPIPADQLARLVRGVVGALQEMAPVPNPDIAPPDILIDGVPVKAEDVEAKSIAHAYALAVDDVAPLESSPLPPKPATAGRPVELEPVTKLETMAPKEVVKAIEDGKTWPSRIRTVTPETSVFPGYLICLHCERHLQTLGRHLMAAHDQTFEQYRKQFKLAADYPTQAPRGKVGRHGKPRRVRATWPSPGG